MNSRSLKLALVTNLYPPYIVGGNPILAADVTAGLRRRGHIVHILTGRGRDLPQDGYTHSALNIDLDHKEDLFLGGLPLTWQRLIQWHLYNHGSYRGVLATLRRLQPDLVVIWNLYMASAAPLIAARRLPYPVVAQPADKWLLYTLTDLRPLVPGEKWVHRWGMNAIAHGVQPLLRWLARPDYVLAVSEFIRRLHLAAGYAPAQSAATYLGAPVEKFHFQPHEHPGRAPWRLLFVGQLWAGKGPQVAIEAVRLLRQRTDIPPVELNIFGSGAVNFEEYLQNLINQHDLANVVHLHGFVDHARLVAEFHSHDAYLFCSIWDEPFSGGLLEAMSTGIPTIATSAGGTPEAVIDGINGLLIKPDDPQALADAIVRLMDDPPLYARLGAQGAAAVRERWSFEQYIDRLEVIYRAIAAGRQPRQPVDLTRLALTAAAPTPNPNQEAQP